MTAGPPGPAVFASGLGPAPEQLPAPAQEGERVGARQQLAVREGRAEGLVPEVARATLEGPDVEVGLGVGDIPRRAAVVGPLPGRSHVDSEVEVLGPQLDPP